MPSYQPSTCQLQSGHLPPPRCNLGFIVAYGASHLKPCAHQQTHSKIHAASNSRASMKCKATAWALATRHLAKRPITIYKLPHTECFCNWNARKFRFPAFLLAWMSMSCVQFCVYWSNGIHDQHKYPG